MSVAWLRRRPAHVPTWVIDAGWAAAVAVAVTIAIRAAREPGARPPDLLAYILGWTMGALLVVRRRWPVAVLVASFAALQIYYVLNYPGISAAVPLAVALYTAGAAGYVRWALLIAGWFVAGPLIFRLLVDPEPVLPVLSELVRELSLWLAILLLGDAVRSRRILTRQQRLPEAERARSEGLLRNMLPQAIAERLKQRQEGVIADGFSEVTVLFADIVDFTAHAEHSPPEATVALLNDLFSRFDVLTEARGWRRSRPSGMPTWWPAAYPRPDPIMPWPWPSWPWGCWSWRLAAASPMAGRSGCASGSPPAQWWPGSSAGGGSAMTCGATR
jgi:Adenylate and Guanylate cyclase catalytic domain